MNLGRVYTTPHEFKDVDQFIVCRGFIITVINISCWYRLKISFQIRHEALLLITSAVQEMNSGSTFSLYQSYWIQNVSWTLMAKTFLPLPMNLNWKTTLSVHIFFLLKAEIIRPLMFLGANTYLLKRKHLGTQQRWKNWYISYSGSQLTITAHDHGSRSQLTITDHDHISRSWCYSLLMRHTHQYRQFCTLGGCFLRINSW